MREIKFRGKTKRGDGTYGWIYGDYIQSSHEIVEYLTDKSEQYFSRVIPDTVGQFTGLKDKNGVKIYEGDIIPKYTHFDNIVSKDFIKKCEYPEEIGKAFFEVIWNVQKCAFEMVFRKFTKNEPRCKILSVYSGENSEVIGNIHDNPELLKNK